MIRVTMVLAAQNLTFGRQIKQQMHIQHILARFLAIIDVKAVNAERAIKDRKVTAIKMVAI